MSSYRLQEVKMKVLRFGPNAKALEPEKLAREVREETEKRQGVFRRIGFKLLP